MKKVLLTLAFSGVGIWAVAQSPRIIQPNKAVLKSVSRKSIPMNFTGGEAMGMPSKPVVSTPGVAAINETIIGETFYDLQTNGSICERLINHSNGKFSATWTYSNNSSGFPNRGTAYNFFDGTTWGAAPAARIETTRTGWPSIGVTNTGKEVVVSHGTATNTLIQNDRATYGAGAWTQTQANTVLPISLWPKMVSEGQNIHLIGLTAPTSFGGTPYNGMDGAMLYSRSTDGGATWSAPIQLPGCDVSNYEAIGGDAYNIDVRGNVVAVAVGDLGSPVRVWKSEDNGATWTSHKALDNGIDKFIESSTLVDTVGGLVQTCGGSLDVLIDNNDIVHVTFDQLGFSNEDLTDGSVSIFMFANFGLGYWNENMGDGNSVLVGDVYWDWDGNNEIPQELIDNLDNYRYGNMGQFASMPTMSIDANNNIYLMYAALTEYTNFAGGYYRHTYGMMTPDAGCTWSIPFDITAGNFGKYPATSGIPVDPDDHEFDECVFASAARKADTAVYIVFSKDDVPGRSQDAAGAVTPSQNDIVFKHISVTDFQAMYNDLGPLDCFAFIKETKCNGTLPVLTASCGTAYSWSTGATTDNITVTQAGTHTVDVTTECLDPNDTTQFWVATITVDVTDVDTTFIQPVVTAQSGLTAVCEGDGTIILTANGGSQYQWSNGSFANPLVLDMVAQSGTYSYIATDVCGNLFNSDTVTVSVYPNVAAEINGATQICIDSTILTATTFTAASYQWSNGSTGTSIVAYDGDMVTLIVSNANCADTSTVTITQLPSNPTATIAVVGNDTEVCLGDTVTLIGSGGATFSWTGGTSNDTLNLSTVAQSGSYILTVTDICGNTDTATVNVMIHNLPATPVITGDKPTLTFTSTNTSGSTGHTWYINANPISGATGNTYTATNWTLLVNNPVWVEYVDSNGCKSAPSNTIILIPTGLDEVSASGFSVYPNPTSGEVFVQNLAGFTYFSVKNIMGQEVLSSVLTSETTKLSLGSYGKGVYFITLSNKAESTTVKVIVK